MASTLHRIRADSPAERWSDEPLPLGLDQKNSWPGRPPAGKRRSRPFTRFLITFCIGVAATLAWQSYGDVAKQMIASSSPVLGWLAPQAASDQAAPAAPASTSADQQLRGALLDLAALRQSMEQLTAQHQQMVGDIATMQAAQQAILRKVAAPASPPPPRQVAVPAHNAVQN